MNNKGLLIVISGPSGTGKGTICNSLVNKNEDVKISVSATTRKPRKGEEEGIHYFFKNKDEFKRMIAEDELLEWAVFCDNYYGTPKKSVQDMLDKGINVILEIEVQGAMQIKQQYPEGVFIFTLPPSLEELKNRITGRGTETEDIIAERLSTAKKEFEYFEKYDYFIINDSIEESVKKIEGIIASEKCKVSRNQEIIKEVFDL